MKTLQPEFKEKIQQITQLSTKVNNDDKQKILSMIKDHAREIEELYNEGRSSLKAFVSLCRQQNRDDASRSRSSGTQHNTLDDV